MPTFMQEFKDVGLARPCGRTDYHVAPITQSVHGLMLPAVWQAQGVKRSYGRQ
jgi:hypothetical protein